MSRNSPKLRHRPSRTVPASITAVVLIAAGGLSATVAILQLVTGSWPAPAQAFGAFLTATPWGATTWLAVWIGAIVIGLIMIIAALKPGGLNAATINPAAGATDGPADTELVMSRRAVARLAASRAELVDGVDSVRVQAAAKRVRLRVGTSTSHRAEVEKAVTDSVHRSLSDAGLVPVPRVVTRAWTKAV